MSATEGDAQYIESHLRAEDLAEVTTVSGTHVGQLEVFRGLSRSCLTFRMTPESNPFAIFGVVDDRQNAGFGCVWMLCTPEVSLAARPVMREAKKWAARWLKYYPKGLHQMVDARNDLHRRWLQLIGFFETEQRVAINGVPFIYVYKR